MGMPSGDMPRLAMLRVNTLGSVLAVRVVTSLRGLRAVMRGLQGAHAIGMADATGEAVIGEAVTGIRRTGIRALAITAWAMATHTTVTLITDIIATAIIPISMDTGPTRV